MFRMAVGHSTELELDDALAEIFAQCDEALGDVRASAALVFATHETDHAHLLERVAERYPAIAICGSSSTGEVSSLLGFEEDSIVVALFASDVVDFSVGVGPGVRTDPADAAAAAVRSAMASGEGEPRLCIALPHATRADPQDLLRYLRAELGAGVPILGGAAASDDPSDQTIDVYQYAGTTVYDDAVTLLLFRGDLSFSFGVATGWRPLGPRATVTRSGGRWVEEIDGDPALAFYERYLGAGDPWIANPLAVYEANGDGFYLRAPVANDRDRGAVAFTAQIPEGSTVQITVAVTDEIFDGTKAAISTALEGFPQGRRPDAALVFSCAIRKYLLGTQTGNEAAIAREMLGPDLPIAGFYCFGELAPVASWDETRFHNQTIVAVLLGA
jgi:hypothetical protein